MELRPLETSDAEAVFGLQTACDIADVGEPDVELRDVLESWEGVDLAADGRFAPGVAYALRGDRPELYVHPDHRGQGWEERLLDFLEPESLYAPESDRALGEALAARGHRVGSAVVRMGIDLAEPPPAPRWPEGFTARRFSPGDDEEHVGAVVIAGMREIGGSDRLPTGQAFAPELSVVVEDDSGSVAAAAIVELWDEGARGNVHQLAVRPDLRGRGLGTATLAAALAAIRQAGARDAVLGVHEHNPGARRIYERAGMTPRYRMQRWVRS